MVAMGTKLTQIALWEAVMPTDREADFGNNSADAMTLALWLKEHAGEHVVAYTGPLDWSRVYAVLVTVEVATTESIHAAFERVRDRIGTFVGIPKVSVG